MHGFKWVTRWKDRTKDLQKVIPSSLLIPLAATGSLTNECTPECWENVCIKCMRSNRLLMKPLSRPSCICYRTELSPTPHTQFLEDTITFSIVLAEINFQSSNSLLNTELLWTAPTTVLEKKVSFKSAKLAWLLKGLCRKTFLCNDSAEKNSIDLR